MAPPRSTKLNTDSTAQTAASYVRDALTALHHIQKRIAFSDVLAPASCKS